MIDPDFMFGSQAAWKLAALILHVLLAIGIHDAARGRETRFVTRGVWTFATVLGGIWAVLAYWLIHESSLTRSPQSPEPGPASPAAAPAAKEPA